jgi:hypothetical protein
MGEELLWILSYVGVAAVFVALLVALDSLLLGLAYRFAARWDQYPQRVGIKLPRTWRRGPTTD